jgi:hypothetical protein
MEKSKMTIRHYVRISLVAMSLMVATSVQSQSAPVKEEPNGGLEILAVMNSPSVCVGTDHLSVRIVVTNRSGEPVELDTSRLSTTAGFVALIDTTEMKFRTQTLGVNSDPVGKARPSAMVQLPSKGFFEQEIHLPIRDQFFSQAGFYRLNLSSSVRLGPSAQSHDVFSSSSAIFELRACESQ